MAYPDGQCARICSLHHIALWLDGDFGYLDFVKRKFIASAETADEESMALRAVESYDVDRRFTFAGIDYLANAQKRGSMRHIQQFGNLHFCCGSINFLVRIGQFHPIVMFQCSKQGIPSQ